MSGLVVDALLIVFMLIALEWRETRWAPRSVSPARRRVLAMRRPAPVLRDATRLETLKAMDRQAS